MTQRTFLPSLRLATLALAACAAGAHAQDGTPANELRLGAYFVHDDVKANDLSGPFTPPGINIRVGDVKLPSGVTTDVDPDETVVTARGPQAMEVPEEGAEAAEEAAEGGEEAGEPSGEAPAEPEASGEQSEG